MGKDIVQRYAARRDMLQPCSWPKLGKWTLCPSFKVKEHFWLGLFPDMHESMCYRMHMECILCGSAARCAQWLGVTHSKTCLWAKAGSRTVFPEGPGAHQLSYRHEQAEGVLVLSLGSFLRDWNCYWAWMKSVWWITELNRVKQFSVHFQYSVEDIGWLMKFSSLLLGILRQVQFPIKLLDYIP